MVYKATILIDDSHHNGKSQTEELNVHQDDELNSKAT